MRALPQIFRGASSSRRMGWLRKISLDLRHSPRISFSASCTFLPGLDPFTGENKKETFQELKQVLTCIVLGITLD